MRYTNFFTNCNDAELVTLWQAYENGNIISENSPFYPYLNNYIDSSSKSPIVFCEFDFLEACAKRFYEKTFDKLSDLG